MDIQHLQEKAKKAEPEHHTLYSTRETWMLGRPQNTEEAADMKKVREEADNPQVESIQIHNSEWSTIHRETESVSGGKWTNTKE